ncbi:hypothetical protein Efla_006466 [Eimeria flavescens]
MQLYGSRTLHNLYFSLQIPDYQSLDSCLSPAVSAAGAPGTAQPQRLASVCLFVFFRISLLSHLFFFFKGVRCFLAQPRAAGVGGGRWLHVACRRKVASEGSELAVQKMEEKVTFRQLSSGRGGRGRWPLQTVLRSGWFSLFAAASVCGFLLLLSPEGAAASAAAKAAGQKEGVKSERRVYSEAQKARAAADQQTVRESGAVALSDPEYTEFMAAHPLVLVLFYAPWCYWSRAALPEFDAAAKLLSHHDPPVIAARVDCSANDDLCTEADIREYPTIRLYVEGEAHAYEGRRYRTHVVHWVDLKVDRDKQLESKEHLDELLASSTAGTDSHVVAVAAFPPDYSKASFQSVARAFGEEVLFGDTTDPAVIKHLQETHIAPRLASSSSGSGQELPRPPFVAVFSSHKGEPSVHIYRGQVAEVNALRSFVRQWLFPVVSLFDADTIGDTFFRDPRPKLVLLLDTEKHASLLQEAEAPDPQSPFLSAFRAVAAAHRASVAATVCGNKKPFEKQLFSVLGVEDEALPQVRLLRVDANSEGRHKPTQKYKPEAPLPSVPSAAAAGEGGEGEKEQLERGMHAFVEAVLSGQLAPYFRSEPPPEVPEGKGHVRTLVASNFATEVAKEPNVLVEFYAPWCGFCRKMEPAYKELARRVAGVSGLLIARVDANRNEVEGVHIAGYPTVYLYRRGHAEPLLYTGDRSTRDMLEWLSLRVTDVSAFSADELMARDLAAASTSPTSSVLEEL